MTSAYDKPIPIPSNEVLTKPFWEATKRGELIIPYCNSCSTLFFYPREVCPNCFSKDLGWKKMSGKGHVYTYTHVRQAVHPSFQSANGHIYAIVQLDEGPKIPSGISGCEPNEVYVDMPVSVVFDDITEDYTLVKFEKC
tara:strand:- start:49 stop:465 length:417 start_codon:yes stop_codon:yes gene_type:complete